MSRGSGADFSDRDPAAGALILSDQALEESVRQLSLLLKQARDSRLMRSGTAGPEEGIGSTPDRDLLRTRALEIYLRRRRRQKLFGRAMFGEPAWDMLLALYMFDEIGARFTIRRLTDHVGAPQTTALRWLSYLETERLVVRSILPTDRRTCLVQLSQHGRSLLDTYFTEEPGPARQ